MNSDDKVVARALSKRQVAALLADISDLAKATIDGLLAEDESRFYEALNQLDAAMDIARNIVELPRD